MVVLILAAHQGVHTLPHHMITMHHWMNMVRGKKKQKKRDKTVILKGFFFFLKLFFFYY
jgi:hypothetical protein